MKKIRATIGDLSMVVMIWVGLTQLHVIPSLYIGKLNATDFIVGIVAVFVTLLFTCYWICWAFLSMVGSIFKMKISPFEPLKIFFLLIWYNVVLAWMEKLYKLLKRGKVVRL